MSTIVTITSSKCAETDSYRTSEVTNDSFDVGAFSSRVNESFAYFDISAIPSYAVFTSASVYLRQYDGSYYNEPVSIRCAPCTNYIANTSVTWNNKPSIGSLYGSLTISSNTDANRNWTISTGFGSNLNDYRVSNYLICKFYIQGASAGDNNAKGFRPSTYSTASYRPQITLEYVLPYGQVNVGDAWKNIELIQVNVGDAWKTVESMQTNVSDVWKNVSL